LAAAQTVANASHPRRLNGRTPASVWESRTPIDPVERVIFELTLERQRFRARGELKIDPEELLEHWRASAVDRRARTCSRRARSPIVYEEANSTKD
jgi:hypothetical protein